MTRGCISSNGGKSQQKDEFNRAQIEKKNFGNLIGMLLPDERDQMAQRLSQAATVD